jgi:uncharacterized membrane protein YfcA
MKTILILTILIPVYLLAEPVQAQDSTQTEITNTPPVVNTGGSVKVTPLTRLEFNLSIIVLVFGLIVILFEMVLIKSKNINANDTIKFIIITIIITSTLYLITAGYSNDQIAPAVGLLGTIAGYLLGRIQSPTKKDEKIEENN